MSANVRSAFKIGFLGIILAAALCQMFPSVFSMSPDTNRPPRPLWIIDLIKFGYQGKPPIYLGPEDEWGFWTYNQGVVFTEPNVVAAFFVAHDNPPGAVSGQGKPSASDPFRLVAVFINSEKGEFIKKLDW